MSDGALRNPVHPRFGYVLSGYEPNVESAKSPRIAYHCRHRITITNSPIEDVSVHARVRESAEIWTRLKFRSLVSGIGTTNLTYDMVFILKRVAYSGFVGALLCSS